MALEGFFLENLGPAEHTAMLAPQMDADARQRIADFASIRLFKPQTHLAVAPSLTGNTVTSIVCC